MGLLEVIVSDDSEEFQFEIEFQAFTDNEFCFSNQYN